MFIRISGQFAQIIDFSMSEAGVHNSALRNKVAQLQEREIFSVEAWRALLDEAAELSTEPAVGLQIGDKVQLKHIGVLGYLVANCETLVDALNTYQLCERRFYGVNFANLEQTGDRLRLFWLDRPGEPNTLFVQVAIATLVRFLRNRFPVSFQHVEVQRTGSIPGDVQPFREYFGCDVIFDSELPGIAVAYQAASEIEPGELPVADSAIRRQQHDAFNQVTELRKGLFVQLQRVLMKLIPENKVSIPGV